MNRIPLQSTDSPADPPQTPGLRPQPSPQSPSLRLRDTSIYSTQHSPRHRSCCAHPPAAELPQPVETPEEAPQTPGLRPQKPPRSPIAQQEPSPFVPQPPGLRPSIESTGSAELTHTEPSRQRQCCVDSRPAQLTIQPRPSLQSSRPSPGRRRQASGFVQPSLGLRGRPVTPLPPIEIPRSDEPVVDVESPGLRPQRDPRVGP